MSHSWWHKLKSIRPSTILVAILAIMAAISVPAAMLSVNAAPPPAEQGETIFDSGPPVVRTETGPAMLFIGDSYTMGPNDIQEYGYPCVAATKMGWQCNVGVQPGTGYIIGGEGFRLPMTPGLLEEPSTSVAERFPRLRERYPADIVVLDAGRNDLQYGPESLRNALLYTVTRAIQSWPNSRIIVISPWLVSQPNIEIPGGDGMTYGPYLEQALRSDPQFDAVTFIDPGTLGWFAGMDVAPYLSADGIHPSVAGHRMIGDLLATELKRRGFASRV
jgi:GDSL-like Lipase/Acylhydrolase family